MERVLFARIAWMDRYGGVKEDDPWASGAGWVQRGEVPWECCNFLDVRGFYYGYSRPAAHADRARLDRIDPTGDGEKLTGVRVIFFAPAPAPAGGGQRIVGWYSSATVLARAREDVPERTDDAGQPLYWFFKCSVRKGLLLPVQERTFQIPRGKDGTGQSNWTFLLDDKLLPKRARWMEEAVEYTKRIEASRPAVRPATSSDFEAAVSGDQGLIADAVKRAAIEAHAMKVARAAYEGERYCEEPVDER